MALVMNQEYVIQRKKINEEKKKDVLEFGVELRMLIFFLAREEC